MSVWRAMPSVQFEYSAGIVSLISRFMGPYGDYLGPTGPRWAPCGPREPCSLGIHKHKVWFLGDNILINDKETDWLSNVQYDSYDIIVTVESVWWLLMACYLFGARTCATRTQHGYVDRLLLFQAGKLKLFGTRPNWVVSYIAYIKFHSPRPVFRSPGQIFTRIGERASANFPACFQESSA